jgi:hypothetical protein
MFAPAPISDETLSRGKSVKAPFKNISVFLRIIGLIASAFQADTLT